MTQRMVARNNRQLSLGEGNDLFAGTGEPVVEVEDAKRVTWLLLHCYDREAGEIRLELSCPSEMSEKQITEWRERIIVDPVPFNGDIDAVIVDVDEQDLTIDIDVARRAD